MGRGRELAKGLSLEISTGIRRSLSGLTRDDTHTQKKDATHEKEERHTGQNTTY